MGFKGGTDNLADLEVDGDTLSVDAAKDSLGINTATPQVTLDIHYTGSGNPINMGITGGGISIYFGTGSTTPGLLHYLNTDGGWELTNANATGSLGKAGAGNASLLGFANGTDPLVNGMLINGWCNSAGQATTTAFSTGSVAYIFSGSEAQSGFYTSLVPSGSDAYVRVIGYYTDTPHVIYFNPDSTWVEIS
jgi:hypothetical protein